MYKVANRTIYSTVYKKQEFIRFKNKIVRQVRKANAVFPFVYYFLFLHSFYLSVTSRLRVFSLLILCSTPFIPQNQSYAQHCYRISKFLEEDGDSCRRRTNEDERLNMIPLAPPENTVPVAKTRFIRCKTRYATHPTDPTSRSACPFFFAEFSFRIQQE